MRSPAPLQVTVEVSVLDTGAAGGRVFRLTHAIGEDGIRLRRDLPWEAGRPVRIALSLPEDPEQRGPIVATGVIRGVPPESEDTEDRAQPRAIELTWLDETTRDRIVGYVQERMLIP